MRQEYTSCSSISSQLLCVSVKQCLVSPSLFHRMQTLPQNHETKLSAKRSPYRPARPAEHFLQSTCGHIQFQSQSCTSHQTKPTPYLTLNLIFQPNERLEVGRGGRAAPQRVWVAFKKTKTGRSKCHPILNRPTSCRKTFRAVLC